MLVRTITQLASTVGARIDLELELLKSLRVALSRASRALLCSTRHSSLTMCVVDTARELLLVPHALW
jgi:hypothetical protein